MRRAQVPLWVALILKAQDKCNIVPPLWLNCLSLEAKLEDEKKHPDAFSNLPWNWLEMSHIFLTRAPDDVADNKSKLKVLVQDLREARLLKSKRGMKELNESNILLNGLSLMEMNEIRPSVLLIMNRLRQLYESTEAEADEA